MLKKTILAAVAAAAMLGGAAVQAADPVKIGMVTTLSGPGGYLGEDVRDAFLLAIEQEGGKLGGVPVELLVEDDALKPDQGKQIAAKMLRSDRTRIMTGIIFSNVAGAVVPDILAAGAVYISPNAGPSGFSGKGCNKNYFVASWQNDNLHEAAGELAKQAGYKNLYIFAPNYQAGRDALAGFKRQYGGGLVGESYVQLNQTDFAAEIAQIRAAKPDAVYNFLPGGMGINFLKQWAASGLQGEIPLVLPAPSSDTRILNAIGDSTVGIISASHWSEQLDNPANKAFVAAFQKKYNRMPTEYAAQGYDTALLLAAALKSAGGDDPAKVAAGLKAAPATVKLTRGAFEWGKNQHPVQDWYSRMAEKGPDGKITNKVTGKILSMHADAFAQDCAL